MDPALHHSLRPTEEAPRRREMYGAVHGKHCLAGTCHKQKRNVDLVQMWDAD
jgi:hypothetical protein